MKTIEASKFNEVARKLYSEKNVSFTEMNEEQILALFKQAIKSRLHHYAYNKNVREVYKKFKDSEIE